MASRLIWSAACVNLTHEVFIQAIIINYRRFIMSVNLSMVTLLWCDINYHSPDEPAIQTLTFAKKELK